MNFKLLLPIRFLLSLLLLSALSASCYHLRKNHQSVKHIVEAVINQLYDSKTQAQIAGLDNQQALSLFSSGEKEILATRHWMFTVNVPVIVSVMRSTRQPVIPFWLIDKGFKKTDMIVANRQVKYEVWQKLFPAGKVGLGINGFENYPLHYFVSVAPQKMGDKLSISHSYPAGQYISRLQTGAFTYHDWDELVLTAVPESMAGQQLLTTIRGRGAESHLVGAFRTTAYPSSPQADQVMLTWSGDPATTMDIQWRTNTHVLKGVIVYREKGATYEYRQQAIKYLMEDRELMNDRRTHRFTAHLTGLKPGRTYEFNLEATPDWTNPYSFKTSEKDEHFSFIWFGDTHYSPLFGDLAKKAAQAHPEAAFYSIAGDMVSDGLYRNQWDDLFEYTKDIISGKPLMSVLGNHDNRSGLGALMYREFFSYPKNGPGAIESEHTYAFQYKNALFLMIDATSPIEAQTAWIEQQLSKTNATWKFAMFHFPPYNAGEPYQNIQQAWVPVFDKYHVDMVMSGHVHYYLRSQPMVAGNRTDSYNKGTAYVISIGIPAAHDKVPPEPYAAVRNMKGHLYQYLKIDGSDLYFEAMDAKNNIVDSFSIHKPPY